MEFTEIIQKVNTNKKLVPDLIKSEKGNNFRSISESAILDVIDPILREAGWFYTVTVKKSDLQIREAFGSKGKKLQFIATVEIALDFETYDIPVGAGAVHTEAVGMGIDDNDKAMGKAYTYAVKYALLKLFRLRYGDDPDAKASEPLYLDKPKEPVGDKESPKKEEKPSKPNSSRKPSERPMSEAQRDYILGLMEKKGITSQMMMGKFSGLDPKTDEFISMPIARAMIKYLEETDDLPF